MNDRASAEALETLEAYERQARIKQWRAELAERTRDKPEARIVGSFRIEVSAQDLAQRSKDVAAGITPF